MRFKDKSEYRTWYQLKLKEENWPLGLKLAEDAPELEQRIAAVLSDEQYLWRRLRTITRKAELPEEEVREVLDHLETQKLVRQSEFDSLDGEDMWGLTSRVGVLPEPKTD